VLSSTVWNQQSLLFSTTWVADSDNDADQDTAAKKLYEVIVARKTAKNGGVASVQTEDVAPAKNVPPAADAPPVTKKVSVEEKGTTSAPSSIKTSISATVAASSTSKPPMKVAVSSTAEVKAAEKDKPALISGFKYFILLGFFFGRIIRPHSM
jgi:hypothetical protein